jgi:hypothetical protein
MYGYVFGAAKANVWHNPADYFHWMYPGYFTAGAPPHTVMPADGLQCMQCITPCQAQNSLRHRQQEAPAGTNACHAC